jgi:hypothetical protein
MRPSKLTVILSDRSEAQGVEGPAVAFVLVLSQECRAGTKPFRSKL